MRKVFATAALFLLCLSSQSSLAAWGGFIAASTSVSVQSWHILPQGAGGNLIRTDIAYDGTNLTKTVTTDTDGAWVWNPSATALNGATGSWLQLVTATSMPSTFVNNAIGLSSGMYALAAAPTAANTLYMVYNVFDGSGVFPPTQGVYKSTNKGLTWSLTNFTPIDVKQHFGGDSAGYTASGIKTWGARIAIDPTSANIVAISTGANGLNYSLDGGVTWSVASIPTATIDGGGQYPGYTGIAISGFNHSVVFASSYGNGIYKSTTGLSGSWTRINSGVGPVDVVDAMIDPANGNYYCMDGNGNGWQYAGTTWTQIYSTATAGDAVSIAVDPNTANHIIIGTGNGQLLESTNGTTFGTPSQQQTTVSNDVTWLQPFTANVNTIRFDPTIPKTLNTGSNRAFFTTTYTGTISSATLISWALQSRGIEQLVANRVIVPVSNTPITLNWDTALFTPSFNSYPSTQPVIPGTGALAPTLYGGWSIDACTGNPNQIVVIADGDGDGSGQHSAYSTNGAAGPYTLFPSLPSNVYNGSSGASSGSIACNGSSSNTASNVVWCPNQGACSFSTNCCSSPTWTLSTTPVGTTAWSGFSGGNQNGAIAVAADRVTASQFFLFYNGVGFFKSTNGGSTWPTSLGAYTQPTGAGFQVKATLGQANDFWFSGSNNEPGNRQPCGTDLIHYNGSTLTTITNLICPQSVGFGISASGTGYPVVFAAGFVGGVYGVYYSDNAGTAGATPTWQLLGGVSYPFGSLDSLRDISGDPGIYKQAYTGYGGSGYLVFR